jgi:hypothetical protein
METKPKRSFLETVPSALSAFIVFIVAGIVFFTTDSIWTPRTETGLISHSINDVIIAVGCFVIVRQNPKSVWYVPVICNALLIISSIGEPNFWKSVMIFPICGGWILSVIVSVIAAKTGNRVQKLL